ncbi:MAG TPA: hypothetical protein VHH15_17610 [Actinophytocola sp.]|nr:hypothetical protein [Actinophytocola sp.]
MAPIVSATLISAARFALKSEVDRGLPVVECPPEAEMVGRDGEQPLPAGRALRYPPAPELEPVLGERDLDVVRPEPGTHRRGIGQRVPYRGALAVEPRADAEDVTHHTPPYKTSLLINGFCTSSVLFVNRPGWLADR